MQMLRPLFLVFALLLLCNAAAGQEAPLDRRGAAEAYDKGTAAYLAGDYAQAGGWFETAHRLSPAPAALQQAVRAYRRADDLTRAATLSLELRRDYADVAPARKLADEVLQEASATLVQVEVVCDDCSVTLDGKVQAASSFFVEPGSEHEVSGEFETGTTPATFTAGDAGEHLEISLEAPAAVAAAVVADGERPPRLRDPNPPAASAGLPPRVMLIGAGVTGVLAISTIISGIGANTRGASYDAAASDWQDAGCATMANPSSSCDKLYRKASDRLDTAEASELRTNLLLGSTLVAGAATAVVALFFTDWGDESKPVLSFTGSPQGDLFGRMRVQF